jgi:protein-L-isoaspartate O-methyltransferase
LDATNHNLPITGDHTMNATYSPEDNKLRLYSDVKLPRETYDNARKLGFIWAPNQQLFVAPMWTPEREDFLIDLCGDIEDEDTSLVDRAEQRSERFETYRGNRARDSEKAVAHVKSIADYIPFGQPILVGHHSERRARKDAERIGNGMAKAVKMWQQSEYWQCRAEGAIRHAKYKELPRVRANRIKKIEAEQRKTQKSIAEYKKKLNLFTDPARQSDTYKGEHEEFNGKNFIYIVLSNITDSTGVSYEDSRKLREDETLLQPMKEKAIKNLTRWIEKYQRWVDHYTNRLTYEKAMLKEQGAEGLIEKKPRPTQLPLLNYRQPEGFKIENEYSRNHIIDYPQIEMTKAEYSKIPTDYKGTKKIGKTHRIRTAIGVYLKNPPAGLNRHSYCSIFLTDAPTHEKPAEQAPAPVEMPAPRITLEPTPTAKRKETPKDIEDIKNSLKSGVKIVSAPQLFPTPEKIAWRMAGLADFGMFDRVLEPSAGTGNLLKTIGDLTAKVAVEINHNLSENLRGSMQLLDVVCGDFLEQNGNLGKFDKIIMNPPFENGADIKHIRHAMKFLKPGGRLVALCANGPRQQEQLKPLSDHWEDLPEGSFKEQGTNVNTALLVINA